MPCPINDELVFRATSEEDRRTNLLPISPLVGEMSGRTERGCHTAPSRSLLRPTLLRHRACPSFVMLGLVPSICLRSMGQQILGTRPRMTPNTER
ncbi:hypothetical protein RCCGEPOP_27464, partial [Rhizobium sp. Pop5]